MGPWLLLVGLPMLYFSATHRFPDRNDLDLARIKTEQQTLYPQKLLIKI